MQCFHCAPYSRDEVAPSILLAPSKEQAHLAAELMTDGRHCKLFSQKAGTPGSQNLCTELSVSGAATPRHGRERIHGEDDVIQSGPLLFDCNGHMYFYSVVLPVMCLMPVTAAAINLKCRYAGFTLYDISLVRRKMHNHGKKK